MDDGIRMTIITLNQYMYKTTTYNLGYLPKASSAAFAMGGKAKEYTSFVNVCYYPPPKFNIFYLYIIGRALLIGLHCKADEWRIFALVSATPALTSPPCLRAKWYQRQE